MIDAMQVCEIGGFLPGDLRKEFPVGFSEIVLPALGGFADQFVITWSPAEAVRRPEVAKLWKGLAGRQS